MHKIKHGTPVFLHGYVGRVTESETTPPGMVEVRLPGGVACVGISDLVMLTPARFAEIWDGRGMAGVFSDGRVQRELAAYIAIEIGAGRDDDARNGLEEFEW